MNNNEFSKYIKRLLVSENAQLMSTGTCADENIIIKDELERKIKKHPLIWKLFFKIG